MNPTHGVREGYFIVGLWAGYIVGNLSHLEPIYGFVASFAVGVIGYLFCRIVQHMKG